MNKFLEKIAAEKDEGKKKPLNGFAKAGLGWLGVAGGSAASGVVAKKMNESFFKNINETHGSSDHGTVKKFMRDNGFNGKNTTLNHRSHISEKLNGSIAYQHHLSNGPHGQGPVAFVDPESGHKMVGGMRNHETGKLRNMDVAMHELGHLKDFSKHTKLKTNLQIGANLGTHVAPLAGIGMMTSEKTRDYAPAVAAVPGLLHLRSEGMANYHAYHGIKAHKGAKEANKFLTKMVPRQMAGYAVATMGVPAALYGANKLIDHIHKKRGVEKKSELQKQAFDSDYEEGNEYGIVANRSIVNPMVHDMLTKAYKDPHVHVTVDEFSNRKHPEEFKKRLAEIKDKIPQHNYEEHMKNRTMQWHRDHSWGMGMDKNDPMLKNYIGKEDNWGDEIERPEDAIMHHLKTHYDN